MADTNRVSVGIVLESTFGTIPTNPAFQDIRFTSSSLTYSPQTVVSNEIRSDRQITDLILVGAESGGDLGLELSFGAFDDQIIPGAMFSDWVTTPTKVNTTVGGTIVEVSTTGFKVSSGGTDFKAGHLVHATGFSAATSNGLFRVSGSDATHVLVSGTMTAETSAPSGARIRVVGFQSSAGDIDAAASGLTSTTLDFTTLGLVAGMWLKLGGASATVQFTASACNGWARVESVAANSLKFDIFPSGWGASAETTTRPQIWMGDYIRNGTTEKSFTIEQIFNDIPSYQYLRGQEVNSLTFNLGAQAIATGTANFIGKDAVIQDARESGASTVAQATNDVWNTSSDVGRIGEGGSAVGDPNFVMEASITIENNLRRQNAVGSLGAIGIGVGRHNVTGRLNTYFGSKDLYLKVLNNTASSFDIRLAGGNDYNPYFVIDLPQLKFSGGDPQVPGIDQDVMVDLSFQAYRDATLGYTTHLQRFYYTE